MSNQTEPSFANVEMLFGINPTGDQKAKMARITKPDGSETVEPNYPIEYKPVAIENIRGNESSVTLDTAGFEFVHRPTKLKKFVDDREIEREFYPECVDLVKEITGASSVFIIHHNLRGPSLDETLDRRTKPSILGHVDNTVESVVRVLHTYFPSDKVPDIMKRRFQRINIWRPIHHPAHDYPLTLCDYRSIDLKNDVFPAELEYPASTDEMLVMKYNKDQRWKYVFGLTPDEAIVFKCYDSIQDGSVATYAPHNSFQDPATPEGSPPRESIEVRMIVFFD